MSTTQPIRNADELSRFKNYYKGETPTGERNRLLITMGLNTALRITDILKLRWETVYDFDALRLKTHLEITEQKTGKLTMIILNKVLRDALHCWFCRKKPHPSDYIFQSSRSPDPIDRYQAYRIIKKAADQCDLSGHISCHSLRKTFGYHAWKHGTPPALLMNIFNHSSYRITMRYLCIDQDDKDAVFEKIQL